MKIAKIEKVEGCSAPHYDLTVANNHNFFANNILTHNCNLPARNVVIVGIHRGINEVDPLDFIQMAGRAGRYGIDDAGFVHFIIPEHSTREMQYGMENPRPIESVLCTKSVLAFHLLAEISSREVKWHADVFRWYSRSLAALQEQSFDENACLELLSDLTNMEMVTYRQETGFVQITNLGKVSAWLYYSPYDVHAWYKNFGRLFTDTNNRFDEQAIAWAIGDIPSFDWGYIPKAVQDECHGFMTHMRSRGIVVTQAAPYCVAALKCLKNVEIKNNPFAIPMRDLRYDIMRIAQALKLIDSMYAQWGQNPVWETLPYRIKYGVGEELVPFCRLPGVGAKKAQKLWDLGMRSLSDIASESNETMLTSSFQPAMVTRMQLAAKKILRAEAQ